ncbi:PHD finger and SET domain-containing [Pyrenophora seminiperda CCB06]|uniref:PHD finger and SET domain-containing n=1 Tax=Pyrenophora seminiperda CCB06 TaxID=1302712 RepID=A0A3M7MGH3_9PLEO|nr:PHD finger and SET domain-containing [Pyrenophora seminiperda CCB06]
MTDVSAVQAYADHQPAPVALYAGPPPPPPTFAHASPSLDGPIEEEESSTIKCICGYSDDDGNTVLCEKCDTWQHIVCYYESAQHVPDVHECADCLPRPVDAKSASEKQRIRREAHSSIGERKGRPKAPAKNPKKRPKDPLGSVQPNGWPTQSNGDLQYTPDRKSGSPRDQLPPNKRPKTSHRPSGSTSVISQAPALVPTSRKRGASVLLNGHSPIKSPTNPEGSIEDYSSEFMHLYRQPEPPSAESNSYTRIDVANDIAMWLKDPEALAEASGGKKPQDIFSRIDVTIQELETSTAPDIVKQTDIDSAILAHGLHPQWLFIIAETTVPNGGYVGELKGLIGRKADYYSDPCNRWDLLRHPEPFVFFPPHLPIYIDTRREGNILRYARRSCSPNMSMKILIDSSNDYHFCFLATREISPGEELTVGWDIDSEVQKQLARVVTNGAKEGFRRIQPWVSCVLANFGGCACDTSQGGECLLERARRNTITETKSKAKRMKKSQISPMSTGHATNSRAGSETNNRDAMDEDHMDARSTSGSHKSSSRDITPATHFSLDGDKLSEREKRKIQHQELLFQKLDHDEHKGKRKRNSAGSTLNTPSVSSSVKRSSCFPSFLANATIQRRLGHAEPSPSVRHREHSHGVARKASGSSTKTNGRAAPRPKPEYVNASTQTTKDNSVTSLPCRQPRQMRPPLSFKRKLLQQAQEDKLQRERMRSTSVKMEIRSPALKDVSSSRPSPLPPSPPLEEPSAMDISTEPVSDTRHKELTPEKEPTPEPTVDVEIGEAEVTESKPPEPPKPDALPDAPAPETPREASHPPTHPPTQPPAPPWPSAIPSDSSPKSPKSAADPQPKSVELNGETHGKLELVTTEDNNNRAVTPGSTTGALTESTVARSPTIPTIASPFSPAVNNAVKQPPARKKLSLSDYTNRNRRTKLAQTQSTGSPAPAPLAQSQTTSSPTLSAASLPNNNSPPPKTAEPILPPVVEEAKPAAEVSGAPTIATTSAST